MPGSNSCATSLLGLREAAPLPMRMPDFDEGNPREWEERLRPDECLNWLVSRCATSPCRVKLCRSKWNVPMSLRFSGSQERDCRVQSLTGFLSFVFNGRYPTVPGSV
ncbi:hypothetical protein EMEDMD4_970015 [Sinorhizobium medicae]|uniref:Uncharacterized protein n=1 Tax=Sinorhizobium medicae TaxID=110321 RepID=A0A508XAB3_9HYPH|nr:hypothetical protein EMEDMD4_970015 [Sinorhizobium medicae]